jgi:hypothetical protein
LPQKTGTVAIAILSAGAEAPNGLNDSGRLAIEHLRA